MQSIMVSVYCLAYNHEKYIRDTLEGFVNQKTNFEYEVWVHDDASTDNTTMVIEEYARRYPTIIKPIIQKENQYSKGIGITRNYIYPHLNGKYTAMCEGDDYWCDVNKLQKQVDFLEKHNDYVACVHNTKCYNCINGQIKLFNSSKRDRDVYIEDILQSGSAQFHFSSIVYRTEYKGLPQSFIAKGFGDYSLAIYLATKGRIHYMKDVMSVYRLFTEGSWSERTFISDNHEEAELSHHKEVIRMMTNINSYTKGKYKHVIEAVQNKHRFKIALLLKGCKKAILEEKELFQKQSLSDKAKTIIKAYCPMIERMVKGYKRSNRKNGGRVQRSSH